MQILKKYAINDKHLLCFDVLADEKKWASHLKRNSKELAKNVKVKGYRPGNVPLNIAIKHINPNELLSKSATTFVNVIYDELIKSPEVVDQDILEDAYNAIVSQLTMEKLVVTFQFYVVPKLTKFDYKHIDIKHDNVNVTNLEIENQLNMLVWKTSRSTNKIQKDVGITNTDLVVLNFHGTINGEPFMGSDGENYELDMSANEMLPGFEKNLLGLKEKEKKTFTIKLPSDFFDSSIAGKEAKFDVEILQIKQNLKTKIDESFIKNMHIPNVKTVDDLKEFYKKSIAIQKINTEYYRLRSEIVKYWVDNSELDYYPEPLLKNQRQMFYSNYEKNAKAKHVLVKEYVEKYERTIGTYDKLLEIIDGQAKNNIKLMFIMDEVIEKEKISVTEQDIMNKLNDLSIQYRVSIDSLKKSKENDENFKIELLQEKVFKTIINLNTK